MPYFLIHPFGAGTTLYACHKHRKKDESPACEHINISANQLFNPTREDIQPLAEKLRSLGYQRHHPCHLILPASWCYSANWREEKIASLGMRSLQKHQMRSYELERHLPFDSESLLCDFHVIPKEDHQNVFGVAIQVAPIKSLNRLLNEYEIAINTIWPDSLLCYQAIIASHESGHHESHTKNTKHTKHTWHWIHKAGHHESSVADAFNGTGESIDMIHQAENSSLYWWHDSVKEKGLRLYQPAEAGEVIQLSQQSHHPDRSLPSQVFSLLEACGKNKIDPLIHFDATAINRDDQSPTLFTRPFRWLFACLVSLCICVIVSSYFKVQKAQSQTQLLNQEARTIYQSLFPGERLPGHSGQGVTTAIYSDLMRRKQRHQQWRKKQQNQHTENALLQLQQMLNHMPGNLRFQILELRIEKDWLFLTGNTARHADADRIATALRQAGSFEVAQPSTQKHRTSNTITFHLKITPRKLGQMARSGMKINSFSQINISNAITPEHTSPPPQPEVEENP